MIPAEFEYTAPDSVVEALSVLREAAAEASGAELRDVRAYGCVAGARVLLRVRAVFPSPVRLTTRRLFGARMLAPTASVPARQVQVAVRTRAGKTLAYASLFENGQAKLYASPSCVNR